MSEWKSVRDLVAGGCKSEGEDVNYTNIYKIKIDGKSSNALQEKLNTHGLRFKLTD